MPEGLFDGQVAIVTGGAGGLGRALAARLVAGGALVALVDKDEAQLERVAGELGPALAIPADVTVEEDVAGYVRRTASEHGHVDLFFNNAGVEGRMAKIVDTEMADFDRVMAVNVRGVFLASVRCCGRCASRAPGAPSSTPPPSRVCEEASVSPRIRRPSTP